MINATKTNHSDTTITTSCPVDYVPREDYDALKNQLTTIQRNVATVLIQRHMNKLAHSPYYEALKEARKESLHTATGVDMERINRITAQQISLLANYFYRAGLMDSYDCSNPFQDIADIIGLYDTDMEQLAEEHFDLLGDGM